MIGIIEGSEKEESIEDGIAEETLSANAFDSSGSRCRVLFLFIYSWPFISFHYDALPAPNGSVSYLVFISPLQPASIDGFDITSRHNDSELAAAATFTRGRLSLQKGKPRVVNTNDGGGQVC